MFNLKSYSNDEDIEFVTLPGSILAKEIGKVCCRTVGDEKEVLFTFLWEQPIEGCLTGVGLDASFSLRALYGRSLKGDIPPKQLDSYWRKGWAKVEKRDGLERCYFKRELYEDAVKKGYLKYTENEIQPLARKFISYLAETVDTSSKPHVIYWACGDGSEYEVLGSFSSEHWKNKEIVGPAMKEFGLTTHLLPALKYFESRFKDAKQGLFVFITDGTLDDLQALKDYSVILARRVELGKRNPLKLVLVGVGSKVARNQLYQLDNLNTGTDIDLWDCKFAEDMRDLVEIFAELANENQIIAQTGKIYDDKGNLVKFFSDGVPGKAIFKLPADSKFFEIKIKDITIKQSLVMPEETKEASQEAKKE